jgi:hypothetical protein
MSTPAPPAPLLTEVVDTRSGLIRARGHLTVQGADLLRGTVRTLQQLGHRRITLDLCGIDEADDEGLEQVWDLACEVAAARGRLIVRRAPLTPGDVVEG